MPVLLIEVSDVSFFVSADDDISKCQFKMSGLLMCTDLERGNVVGARLGDSSGSVWSEE